MLVSSVFCIAIAILFAVFYLNAPKTRLVANVEGASLITSRILEIPADQSSIIKSAEMATYRKNGIEVNITVVQTLNESVAQSILQLLKAFYLAQDLSLENITILEHAILLYNSDRPFIVIACSQEFVILSESWDRNLALDAAVTQVDALTK